MNPISTVIIDFDGCLTTGKLTIDSTGKELFKEVHSRDSRAIRELCAKGYHVVIMTASSSPIIKAYAQKVGAELIVTRDKSDHSFTDYAAIGDDSWDIPLLEKAALKFCPADAFYNVKQIPGIKILKTKGGEGVIAELIDYL